MPVAKQKTLLVPVVGFLCPSHWMEYTFNKCTKYYLFIRMNRIAFRLSTKYDWIINTRNFFFFLVCMENESKCKWRNLKIIDTSFLNVIANLFKFFIFIFLLLYELFWLKRFNYFVNRINWKLEEAAIKIWSVLL